MGINSEFPKKLLRVKNVLVKDRITDEVLMVIRLDERCPYHFVQLYFGIDDEKVYVENAILEEKAAFDRYRDDRT